MIASSTNIPPFPEQAIVAISAPGQMVQAGGFDRAVKKSGEFAYVVLIFVFEFKLFELQNSRIPN